MTPEPTAGYVAAHRRVLRAAEAVVRVQSRQFEDDGLGRYGRDADGCRSPYSRWQCRQFKAIDALRVAIAEMEAMPGAEPPVTADDVFGILAEPKR